MKRINALNLGTKRLLLILSIFISLGVVLISNENVNSNAFDTMEGIALASLYFIAFGVGSFLAFWLVTRLVLWIIDGYKN